MEAGNVHQHTRSCQCRSEETGGGRRGLSGHMMHGVMTRRKDGGWACREERKGRGTDTGLVISLEMAVGTLGWDSA